MTVALASASIVTQSGSAVAQKTDPTTDSKNLNTSDRTSTGWAAAVGEKAPQA